MAEDPVRQRIVLFSGVTFNGTHLADTHEWNGAAWQPRPTAVAPPARARSALAYDAAGQRVLLFGGSSAGQLLADTWSWNGTAWTLLQPANSPPARAGHGLVLDTARQRLVLFGGQGTGATLGDTWEWDGATWLLRTPMTSPAPRSAHAMAYDSARQRVVLFGGNVPPSWAAETWEYDGANWQQLMPTVTPTGRVQAAMAFDATTQRTVLFGGQPTPIPFLLDDTWSWNGVDWTAHAPPARPTPRAYAALANHTATHGLVLFGGTDLLSTAFADTWIANTTSVFATATTRGNGCGTPPVAMMPTRLPVLGQQAAAEITNCPTTAAMLAIGTSDASFGTAPLPMSLTFVGMPGCTLLQSMDVLAAAGTPTLPGMLSVAVAIPPQPNLLGTLLHAQAFVYAPGANALEVLASNALDWRLGQ